MENYLRVKKLRPAALIPARSTGGSAGYDLTACLESPLLLPARERVPVPTGLAIEIPAGTVALVFGRSGLGIRHGVAPSNAVGVIDSDYRGEIVVGLSNSSDTDYTILPGERIAQLVLTPILTPAVEECETLSETARGAAGFGSTGRCLLI